MTPCVLGIDVGLDGALACLALDGRALAAIPMPVIGKPRAVCALTLSRWIAGWIADGPRLQLAVVERVHSFPGQGVKGVFSFGMSFGIVLGVLHTFRIPLELVTPRRWKSEVLAGTAKDKPAALAYAARRFPSVALVPPGKRTPHDGLADALCLAEFARRLAVGESTKSA